MAGIYIHIPFCKQACYYCDFHFSTSLKNKLSFLKALEKEIALRKDFFLHEKTTNKKIDTIYFGGGTPSMLEVSELMGIFEILHKYFEIDKHAEITLEANPDDLSIQKLRDLKATPLNRLSIGIQSFYDEDLHLMNRAHNAKEALTVVQHAQDNDFNNISIDLIYGIPTLTHQHWEQNLRRAFDLDVKHISAYCLTVEPKTALDKLIATGKIKNVDEQHSSEQFEMMLKEMKSNDFQQYEISNFCKDQFYSRHNSNYWLKENYLGLGPSAHSYNGRVRQWNVANNAKYIRALENNLTLDSENALFEQETLTLYQRYNEYVLTSLRTIWGTDLNYIKQQFGDDFYTHCLKETQPYFLRDQIRRENDCLFLSDAGKLFADKISSDLFITP
ncbi:MAG TPA: radical SAM family heme chaperone HemW [Bacteroidia bacterium]|jgi:oxygen-independent coproporphyrinogen-3 oxidase|nr:radical SAM family heme chaperone HemW [Bacteroidia bacterium]